MQPAPVTFVRHAMPAATEGTDPTAWHLGDEGIRLAHRLAERLELQPRLGALVTSSEPKAVETAAAIATRWEAEVVEDDRLREVARPWIGDGYRAVAHRYLRGDRPEGWEPHEDVAARTGAALREARQRAGDGAVVVVSHGLALAVHLGATLGPDFDQDAFWRCLAFPDAWMLDISGTIRRPLRGVSVP